VRRALAVVAVVAHVALLAPAAARADGAFPDAMRLLLPADRPQQLMLGTNFGLVSSTDGGGHWSLVCEEAVASGGETVTQYLMAAPPGHTLYAMSSNQLAVSADDGCSWTTAGGSWTDPFFTDTFADPVDPARIFALATVPAGGALASSLFTSHDAGRSFGGPLFQAGPGLLLTGVESAASAPGTVYLTEFGNPGGGATARVARSNDGGSTFAETDFPLVPRAGEPRLAAVDPRDPEVIYYRVVGLDDDQLAISRDGGATARVALALRGPMTAFLRQADGTLLVGSKLQGAFRSSDGGQTFAPWPEAPHLRSLAERAGVLYAVADDAADGFAVASSSDGGRSWTPRLRFRDLCGIRPCSAAVSATCQLAWQRLVNLLGITGCPAAPPPPPAAHGCTIAGAGATGPLLLVALLAVARMARRRRAPANDAARTLPA
jgi:hypothetical protein